MIELPDKRTIERALRDAGLSSRQAKRFVAVAWSSLVGEQQALVDELDEMKARIEELSATRYS